VAEFAIVVVLSRVGAKRKGAPAVERVRINAWTRARPLFPTEQVQQDFRGWSAFAGTDSAAPMDQPLGMTLRAAAN
jgi:hypothetical protein